MSMPELSDLTCVPCRGGVPPLTADEIAVLSAQLTGWTVVNDRRLEKTFTFADFKSALGFVDVAGAIAEEQRHHPEIVLSWGKVFVRVWTHKIDGLTQSDFILAAKIDRASS
jgi:4a-hydroxytetrahydrobiopterin dehydratase